MLPGPILVIACPRCHAPARLPTLESGNTFGATFWTDGFVDAPMLPATPVSTRCPACKALYWVEDAPRLGEISLEARRHGPRPQLAQQRRTCAPAVRERRGRRRR